MDICLVIFWSLMFGLALCDAGTKTMTFQWEQGETDLETLKEWKLWSTQKEYAVNAVFPNDYTEVLTIPYDPAATQPYQSPVDIIVPDGEEVNLWFVMQAIDNDGIGSIPSIAAIPLNETEPGPVRIDFKPPGIPTALDGNYNNQSKMINLTWTAPSDEDVSQYRVLKSSVSGGPYVEIGIASTDTYSYSVPSEERGKWIYFVVKAEDIEANVSAQSAEKGVRASMGAPFSLRVTVTTN